MHRLEMIIKSVIFKVSWALGLTCFRNDTEAYASLTVFSNFVIFGL